MERKQNKVEISTIFIFPDCIKIQNQGYEIRSWTLPAQSQETAYVCNNVVMLAYYSLHLGFTSLLVHVLQEAGRQEDFHNAHHLTDRPAKFWQKLSDLSKVTQPAISEAEV